MRYSHRYFVRGRITDGDSTDVEGQALLECLNLELDAGIGQALVRPPLREETVIGGPDNLPAAPQGYVWYDVCTWDSGINPLQHNTMLIYRRKSNTGAWEDYFCIYSNAPHGGDKGYATQWEALELNLAAPVCNPTPVNGGVRVALGNQTHSMVHLSVVESGSRTYPSGITITSTTSRTDPYGAGGKVVNGWIWDHRRLYVNTGITAVSSASATAANPLPTGSWRFACILVWDDGAVQYGGAVTIDGDYILQYRPLTGIPLASLTLTFSADVSGQWSKRITHVAVYAQCFDTPDGDDDIDWYRVALHPFNAGFTTPIVITGEEYWNAENVWSADSVGRVMPTTKAQAEDDIDIKCAGFVHRRKRMYAWGIAGDPGQSQFAVSVKDNIISGQIDVFPRTNRIWIEGSRATTHAVEWSDRLLQFTAVNAYLIDLEQRIDDQTMKLGIGTGTTYTKTIAVSDGGVFFANADGVWLYRGSLEDVTYNAWKREWRRIPEAYRQEAVAGWNRERTEYWLCVQLAAQHYRVYVYCADMNARMWKTYQFFTSSSPDPIQPVAPGSQQTVPVEDWTCTFEPRGFFHDADGAWLIYGRDTQNRMHVYEFREWEDTLAYDESVIYYALATQWQGVRADEQLLGRLDLQRARIQPTYSSPTLSENHLMLATMYMDRSRVPVHVAVFRWLRRMAARLRLVRCSEYMVEVRGRWEADRPGSERPAIYEITVDTHDQKKRTR